MKKRLSSFLPASKWSKKSFQYCKRLTAFLIILLLSGAASLAAQSMSSISMPEISGPSMPSMPSLSVGSVSTGSSTGSTSGSTSSSGSSTGSGSSSTLGTGLTASSLLGLSSTTGLSTLSSLLGSDSDSALLTSLLGSGSSDSSLLTALSGSTIGGNNTTTTLLLTQIIDRLDKLSKQLEGQSDSANTSAGSAGTSSSDNAGSTGSAVTKTSAVSASGPGLIRFRVAGYDIISSFTDLYISTPEQNGTFLLTADRTYTADNRRRTETVYMLFSADPAPEGSFLNSYTVSVSLLQDSLNANSFLYRLSQAAPLYAEKTGNLISIRLNDSLQADILLQLE